MAPFGTLAALAIVIVVGGTVMLTNTFAPVTPSNLPGGSLAASIGPAGTPIQVGAGQVAWLSAGDDGTYSLNFAQVDQVCPANARPDCAPIPSNGARHLPTIRVTPHTVLSSPGKSQLVVVDASAKGSGGGSLYVVSIPAGVAVEPGNSPTVAASSLPSDPLGSPSMPAGSGGGASEPPATPVPTRSPTPTPALTAPAESTSPPIASGTPAAPTESVAAAGSETPAPTPSTPPAPSGSERPTRSPDSSSSGSGPSPSAGVPDVASASGGTTGPTPEPTATALAIISGVVVVGETADYSPDGTMLAFSARPADGGHGPDIYLWRLGDATAHPVTTDHASIFSGWVGQQLIGSRAVDADGQPAGGNSAGSPDSGAQAPGPGGTPGSSGSAAGGATPATETGAPSPAPSLPAASPRGRASLQTVSGAAASATITVAGASPTLASTPEADGRGAVPRSFLIDPATEVETPLAAPAWRPVVDPTGRFVAYWAGSLRYDAATLTWLPDRGVLVLARWAALAGTDPDAVLAPVPLLADGSDAALSGDWDIRWDASGTHIGLWTADPGNPDIGRLSLLTVDPATGRVDPSSPLLQGVPALAGFSIGADRLAWATPPGQDGEGSRVQVLAWSGANAGNIDSQPVPGDNPVVVVR